MADSMKLSFSADKPPFNQYELISEIRNQGLYDENAYYPGGYEVRRVYRRPNGTEFGLIENIYGNPGDYQQKKVIIDPMPWQDGLGSVYYKSEQTIIPNNGKYIQKMGEYKAHRGKFRVSMPCPQEYYGNGYKTPLVPEFVSPQDRTFSTGFKGTLEKLALKISSDANGVERPGVKKIGSFLFNMIRRVR